MKRTRFTEEKLIAVVKEHEAVARTADLARNQGASEALPHIRKIKINGVDNSEVKRLKQLYYENEGLKKLLADQMSEGVALRELL